MDKSILIVIDYQNDFVSPDGKVAKKIGKKHFVKCQKISTKIQRLINEWNKDNKIVLFLVSDYSLKYYKGAYKEHKVLSAYGDVAIPGTKGFNLYKIKPGKNNKFIVKNFFDGFYKTKLDNYLKKYKIKNVYLCGVNTDICIFHTAIGAIYRGYKVYIFKNATETSNVGIGNKKIFLDYLNKYTGVNIINAKK